MNKVGATQGRNDRENMIRAIGDSFGHEGTAADAK